MLVHALHRLRPARVASVLAVLGLIWFWLSSATDLSRSAFSGYDRSKAGADSEKAAPLPELSGDGVSRIAKVTVAANKLDSAVIHRALQTHKLHNARHGYRHHVATQEAVSGLIENDRQGRPKGAWTKPAYLLAVLVDELEKPADERLEWLFWFDADTVIMNTHTPLETFLPPKNLQGVENVDLLIASNWDGLNSGVFALRVSPWSVSFMSAVLAYPIYKVDRLKTDRFRDQSAFQFLLQDKGSPLADTPMKGHDHWIEVPMRWFNSLPVNNAFFKNGTWLFGKPMYPDMLDKGTAELYDDGQGIVVKPWKVMQGDMVVHFAGTTSFRDSWMEPWLERAEAELPEWSNATTQYTLEDDALEFWEKTDAKMVIDRKASAIEEVKKERERKAQEKKEKALKTAQKNAKTEKDRLAKERKKEEADKKKEAKQLDKEVVTTAEKKAVASSTPSAPAPSSTTVPVHHQPPSNTTHLYVNGTASSNTTAATTLHNNTTIS